jgi:hypothetical protein
MDTKGNFVRNRSNFWNILGTIGGGLVGGMPGALVANQFIPRNANKPITNWGKDTIPDFKNADDSGQITPSNTFIQAENRIKELIASGKPRQEIPSEVQFTGFEGPWGERMKQIYEANKDNEVFKTMLEGDNTITADEIKNWQNSQGLTPDAKFGRLSFSKLNGGQGSFSWINPVITKPVSIPSFITTETPKDSQTAT